MTLRYFKEDFMAVSVGRGNKGVILGILVLMLLGCTSSQPNLVERFIEAPPLHPVVAGEVRVTLQDPNLVCVETFNRDGRSGGVSCTSKDSDTPMVGISGNANSAQIVVLDPTKRAVVMRLRYGATWFEVPLMERNPNGNLIATNANRAPDQVDVLDENGEVLSSVPP